MAVPFEVTIIGVSSRIFSLSLNEISRHGMRQPSCMVPHSSAAMAMDTSLEPTPGETLRRGVRGCSWVLTARICKIPRSSDATGVVLVVSTFQARFHASRIIV